MSVSNEKTVVVGMSGGVDSSVAAYLLREQGYHVIGITMLPWQECAEDPGEGACRGQRAEDDPGESACRGQHAEDDPAEDARRVAQMLGIEHYVVDLRKEFQEHVIDHFVREYRMGRTPNPCVVCNRWIKWGSLLQRGLGMGADQIATGHYARVVRCRNGRYAIASSVMGQKDQSYALYGLTQEQLSRTQLPLGIYTKPQIRKIAADLGLCVADKPDSQEICFVPDGDRAGFIDRMDGQEEAPGNFVTADGQILGRHKGISHYTVGQRRGLGLAMGRPVFVTQIRPDTREVVIGGAEDVFTDRLTAEQMNYMGVPYFEEGQEMTAKIRYSHGGERCVVSFCSPDRVLIRFLKKVRAVTPGQAVVFYQDDIILGGGVIC